LIAWIGRSHPRAFIFAVLLLAMLWYVCDFAYVSIDAEVDYATKADVIIVLGCRIYGDAPDGLSYCSHSRAIHGADLYKRDLAAYIIVSGGMTESDITEASVLSRLLRENGVPESAIVQENQAHNTIQNLTYSRGIMQERGWQTAILVTEPFHINRSWLIAHDLGMAIYSSPATDTPNWNQPLVRAYNLSRDTVSLMLYQAKQLVGVRE
jgi:uncharacterized SAM-binding protein YcdF (DUF218 family)